MTTQNEIILRKLTERAGQWVPMPDLVEASGAYAVHSRVADLRAAGHQIENTVDRSSRPHRSYYRLLVAQPELPLA